MTRSKRTLTSVSAWIVATSIAASVFAQAGGPYDLTWSTIGGGGATFLNGGSYQLGGTIGQPDAGALTGGSFSLSGGFWGAASGAPTGSCPCTTASDCRNNSCAEDNACNCVQCMSGSCVFSCTRFGNASCDAGHLVNLDDILDVVGGFSNAALHPNADIDPCGGNGIVNLDDILKVLAAFGGANPCGCLQAGAAPLCGSISP